MTSRPELDDEDRLREIKDTCRKVSRTLKGITPAKYLRDPNLHDATVMRLIVIGEAAHKLSAEAKRNYPEIPWDDVITLRNKAAHYYAGLTPLEVLQCGIETIPALLRDLR